MIQAEYTSSAITLLPATPSVVVATAVATLQGQRPPLLSSNICRVLSKQAEPEPDTDPASICDTCNEQPGGRNQ